MTTTPKLNVFALIVTDMPRALAFYRALGLDIPASADSEPHVDVEIADGIRFSFDDEAMVRGFMPSYQPSHGTWGSLAFEARRRRSRRVLQLSPGRPTVR